METSFRMDHVVIAVADLEAAIEDYQSLGFNVIPGGEHETLGTHNALIPFIDESYLELIAFKEKRPPNGEPLSNQSPAGRVRRWREGVEGLVDFALLPWEMEEDIRQARQKGLALAGPLDGGRVRPDGQLVAWQFAFPDNYDLPFLCGDITPRSLRVPEGEVRLHTNGATGILALTIAVRDLDAAAARYEALLGVSARPGQKSSPDRRTVTFKVGTARLTLASPGGAESPLHGLLARRGEGPCELYLRTTNEEAAGPLAPAHTHGAPIQLLVRGKGD